MQATISYFFPKIGNMNRPFAGDVILLLRPESFSFFLSYFNLLIPVRFR